MSHTFRVIKKTVKDKFWIGFWADPKNPSVKARLEKQERKHDQILDRCGLSRARAPDGGGAEGEGR